jgi:hypothetical protein
MASTYPVFLLQRNLKVMISMGLSAKQEQDDRFQQIKKEVVEMIKMQAPSLELKVSFLLCVIMFLSLSVGMCLGVLSYN